MVNNLNLKYKKAKNNNVWRVSVSQVINTSWSTETVKGDPQLACFTVDLTSMTPSRWEVAAQWACKTVNKWTKVVCHRSLLEATQCSTWTSTAISNLTTALKTAHLVKTTHTTRLKMLKGMPTSVRTRLKMPINYLKISDTTGSTS